MQRKTPRRNPPLSNKQQTKRPIGSAKNKPKIPKSFFKPLPGELLDAFAGNP
jgi:hypothetical protein